MENTGGRIAVIGGGASGCMAAIAAAQAGCRVTLFEKNEKIAKKIYATGNGRCNLTNLFLDESCYHTRDEAEEIPRVLSMIGAFSQKDLICFFREAGVPVHDREGYVYPRTDQAETVARALEKCMQLHQVQVYLNCKVLEIGKEEEHFRVRYCFFENDKMPGQGRAKTAGKGSGKTAVKNAFGKAEKNAIRGKAKKAEKKGSYHEERPVLPEKEAFCDFDAVILCTGGLAGPSFGCSGDGYRFAQTFSHSLISPLPALTRLISGHPFLRRAAGVRCHASVTLLTDSVSRTEDGELQITEDSISGIPVFQISGRAARLLARGHKVRVRIDFLPEFTMEEFEKEIQYRLGQDRDQMLGDLLLGLAHRKVIDLLLAGEGLQAEMKARRLSDEELRAILQKFRSFVLEITGTGGFDHAQVTGGGIPLSEVDDAFASKKCQGLYLAGEVLNVDGRCGGYNLQWAMTGGVLAGRAAARYVNHR